MLRRRRRAAAPLFVLMLGLTAAAHAQTTPVPQASGAAAAAAPGAAAGPQIVSAVINPDPVHAGKTVDATVQTTPDIVAVQVHVMKMTIDIPREADGEFHKTAHVPWMARFFKGTYRVTFVGTCKDGHQTQTEQDVVLN